jgi:hypothetical protein
LSAKSFAGSKGVSGNAAAADTTAPKQRRKVGIPFPPGQSGNPAGRPKGSRHRLTEDFLRELSQDFETNGAAAIVAMRENAPNEYIRVIASLMPKDVNLNVSPLEELTDEQLIERIRALNKFLAPLLDGPDADDSSSPGTASPELH